MRHILLKSAAVVAAGLMGSIGWAQTSWTYSEGDKTVTDGNWVIAVTAYDSAAGTMTLGAITTESEDGVLDLRDMVVGEVAITGLSFPGSEAWKSAAIKELYVNKVVGPLVGKTTIQCIPCMLKGNTTIQVLELGSETIEQITASPRAFQDCSALGRVVFKCPKLLNWNQTYSGGPFSGTVVSNAFHDIVNPGVTNVGQNMFVGLFRTYGDMILTNLQSIGSAFYGGSASENWSKITNVWIRTPQTFGFDMLNSFAGVKTMKLEAPNMKTYGSLSKFTSLDCDVGNVLPRQIETVGYGAIVSCNKLTGTIILTNLTTVSKKIGSSWRGYVFEVTSIKDMELAGPIETIPIPMVSDGTFLTNLVLNLPKLTNVVTYGFRVQNNASVTIYGKPWAEDMRTNLLARVAAPKNAKATTAPANVILKVSKKQGWKEYAEDYGDDFPKENKPEGCFGVWREPFGTGTRGAWMVHFPQADDPTGLCIRVQ